MRLLIGILLSLTAASGLFGNETLRLNASIVPLTEKVNLGEAPLVLVKISNPNTRTIFFEFDSMQISSGVTYSDRTSDLSGTTGRVLSGNSAGSPISDSLFGRNTLGIEPGQSILRIIRLPRIKKSGQVTLSVWLHVPGTSNLDLKTSEWREISAEAEIKIKVTADQ